MSKIQEKILISTGIKVSNSSRSLKTLRRELSLFLHGTEFEGTQLFYGYSRSLILCFESEELAVLAEMKGLHDQLKEWFE